MYFKCGYIQINLQSIFSLIVPALGTKVCVAVELTNIPRPRYFFDYLFKIYNFMSYLVNKYYYYYFKNLPELLYRMLNTNFKYY